MVATLPNETLETLLSQRAGFLKFVERRVGDRALAEDILQAAYLRALESDRLREEGSAVAWFYQVLRNAVIDHYRHHASRAAAMERFVHEFGDEEPTVPEPETRHFVCGCIERVLPALKPAYAEVLRAVDLGEEPLVKFAERHHISASNAAVRAHRARAALKNSLAKFCGACAVHQCLDCICKTTASVESL